LRLPRTGTDVLTIQLTTGEERTVYFDISGYYGKAYY
jgi:hypothetical protein